MLFTGISDDVRLCSCLLKQFFVNKEVNNEEDAEIQKHQDRLQQVLSLFFHSFYLIDSSRSKLIQQAIPDLIQDFVSEIRNQADEGIDSNISIQQITMKLIGFCNYVKTTTSSSSADKNVEIMEQIVQEFHMSLFAAIARELLKTHVTSANLKQVKVLLKDMIKAINSVCNSTSWIKSAWVCRYLLLIISCSVHNFELF